jgi:hypothetical protein
LKDITKQIIFDNRMKKVKDAKQKFMKGIVEEAYMRIDDKNKLNFNHSSSTDSYFLTSPPFISFPPSSPPPFSPSTFENNFNTNININNKNKNKNNLSSEIYKSRFSSSPFSLSSKYPRFLFIFLFFIIKKYFR